jgi:Amt family ammonium transporter
MKFAFDCEGFDCDEDTLTEEQAICCINSAVEGSVTGINTFFLLWAGANVFLMQSGFAMLCAGSVRSKNVKNIMLKNLLDACGGAVGFWSIGYALAYGGAEPTSKGFIGDKGFFMAEGFTESGALIGWYFQFAFAATAATIVAGTVAERCKMQAYIMYSLFLTGFVYPVVVYAIWGSSGFLTAFNEDALFGVGMVDFAGSGVVHMTGGYTAMVAAIILGPRKGRFHDADGNVLEKPVNFPPHSVALQVLGTFILWFGWYGFNPGSALAIGNSGSADVAALCAVTTTLAAASGAVSALFTDSILNNMATGETEYDLTMAMNGCLGGLVAITAGCSVVDIWASVIIGIIGGWVYIIGSKTLVKFKIDDAVDAVPVHFFNGIWGVVAAGLFATEANMSLAYSVEDSSKAGAFYGGDGSLLAANVCGVLFIIAWVTAIMGPFFFVLKVAGLFRVDPLEEDVGLDISHHKGSAYDLSGPKEEDVEELMIRRSQHGKDGVDVPKEATA